MHQLCPSRDERRSDAVKSDPLKAVRRSVFSHVATFLLQTAAAAVSQRMLAATVA